MFIAGPVHRLTANVYDILCLRLNKSISEAINNVY